MQEFTSVSVSSYEADTLTALLNEKSGDGWDVVAIVPTGSTVTAYLSRRRPSEDSDGPTTPESTARVGTRRCDRAAVLAPTRLPSTSADGRVDADCRVGATRPTTVDTADATPTPCGDQPTTTTDRRHRRQPASRPTSPADAAGRASRPASRGRRAAPAAAHRCRRRSRQRHHEPTATTAADTDAAAASEPAAPRRRAPLRRQQPTAAAAPAGWYADPSSRYELRYWDGSQWTEHVLTRRSAVHRSARRLTRHADRRVRRREIDRG